MNAVPSLPCAAADCDDFLSTPTKGTEECLARLKGDIMIIGAGGKMGPTLTMMAARAAGRAGGQRKVWAVSRFSNTATRLALQSAGAGVLGCDLQDRAAVGALPDCENILFLAGQKFGTTGGPENTWAMNTLVPAHVAERYASSRIVAFSTGCVYSFQQVLSGGSREDSPTAPIGDYANSCLGRERIFEFFSLKNGTKICLFRLNYAIDFRYGVLLDVAQKVYAGESVDVTTGHVNVIWQSDANARALQCLELAASPARKLNITGPETVSIRELAERFGAIFKRPAQIEGEEARSAWLSNAGESFKLFGYPTICLDRMVEWTAAWVINGGAVLGKSTHFETRDGKF